jgi:hypothetical protein
MKGVPREVAEHNLNIKMGSKSMKQLPRPQHASARVPCRRLCPPTSPKQQGSTQAFATLGRDLHIHDVLRPRTYKIRYEDGRIVTNAWNIKHLHLFYPLSKRSMLMCQ